MADSEELIKEKAKDYGHPFDYSVTMREMWETLLASPHRRFHGTEDEPSDYDRVIEHCLYMVIGKVIRVWHNPTYRDSMQDIAGYARCLEVCLDRIEEPEPEVEEVEEVEVFRKHTSDHVKSYRITFDGQLFAVTPGEYKAYCLLVKSGHSPEDAARRIYDEILKGVRL